MSLSDAVELSKERSLIYEETFLLPLLLLLLLLLV